MMHSIYRSHLYLMPDDPDAGEDEALEPPAALKISPDSMSV
jgi:hypothetical protein